MKSLGVWGGKVTWGSLPTRPLMHHPNSYLPVVVKHLLTLMQKYLRYSLSIQGVEKGFMQGGGLCLLFIIGLIPVGKHHQILEAHHAETSHVIFLQLSRIAVPLFPCLAKITQCTMIKVPHPKREGGQVILLQNYPHPLSLRDRGSYHFPTPFNIWAPEHDHHLPFYFFTLNKKETQNLN